MTFAQSILIHFISPLIGLLVFVIIAEVIFSWLLALNIVNLQNPLVGQIYQAIRMITRPILEPIRRLLPSFGGLDFSPIVAFFGLSWINSYLVQQVLFQALG